MKSKNEFLEKIQADKKFAEKVFNVDNSKEDVQEIAKEAEIEISLEELEELKEQFLVVANQEEGELSDDDLESVAGGATPAVAATFTIAATGVTLYKERDTVGDMSVEGYNYAKKGYNETKKFGKKVFSGW